MNIYFYPITCTLFLDNTTATVGGDGSLLSIAQSTARHDTPTPFLRPLPVNGVERSFADLVDAVDLILGGWTADRLQVAITNGTGLAGLEDTWSNLVALQYALLAQSFKTEFAANSSSVSGLWSPQTGNLTGTQPQVSARIRINIPQLIVGSVATALIALVTIASVLGPDATDSLVRDGGALDMICLLKDSSLPEIIAGTEEFEAGDAELKALRRKRAQRTFVA